MPTEEATDITVTMPEWLVEEIEDQLDYGDSRSAWIRQACAERLAEEKKEGNQQGMTPETAD